VVLILAPIVSDSRQNTPSISEALTPR
jgi:hypothetical protein